MTERFYCDARNTVLSTILVVLAVAPVRAGNIDVAVLDADGKPVPDVAVYVMQEDSTSRSATTTAIMDQRNTRFDPHMLVVQKGTSVDFPNSDVVAHHVYSFSKPNSFVLPLYKGDTHDPITFLHDGIVTLGCNIHDYMLGYIVVVDTDVFGVTDKAGTLSLSVDDSVGDYAVSIWSPRIRDKELTQKVSESPASITFALQKKLRAAHKDDSDAVEWTDY